jgi:hypothetical protein
LTLILILIALVRDYNTGLPVTGYTGKFATIAIMIYRFTEGKIPVKKLKIIPQLNNTKISNF